MSATRSLSGSSSSKYSLYQSEQQRAECEREIQAFRDQGRKRTQAYEDLQRREAELCAQRDELRHKMEEIVEATAGIMTLANRRIAEQAEEIVQVRQTNYQLRSVITALPGLAWQLTNGLVQKVSFKTICRSLNRSDIVPDLSPL